MLFVLLCSETFWNVLTHGLLEDAQLCYTQIAGFYSPPLVSRLLLQWVYQTEALKCPDPSHHLHLPLCCNSPWGRNIWITNKNTGKQPIKKLITHLVSRKVNTTNTLAHGLILYFKMVCTVHTCAHARLSPKCDTLEDVPERTRCFLACHLRPHLSIMTPGSATAQLLNCVEAFDWQY